MFAGSSSLKPWSRDQVRADPLKFFPTWYEMPANTWKMLEKADACYEGGYNHAPNENMQCTHKLYVDASGYPNSRLLGFTDRESYNGSTSGDNKYIFNWKIYARKKQ